MSDVLSESIPNTIIWSEGRGTERKGAIYKHYFRKAFSGHVTNVYCVTQGKRPMIAG